MLTYNEAALRTEGPYSFIGWEPDTCFHGFQSTENEITLHGNEIREQHYALLMGWA